MPVYLSHNKMPFPPVQLADEDGLLAIGGMLTPERLLEAYRRGIFPWYESEPVCWYFTDPRFVLFPDEFRLNKTVRSLRNKNYFEFTINKDFASVIRYCQKVERPGQHGTWITEAVVKAYTELHHLGYAHSAEVWRNGELRGGLYGIRLGKIFFGESMFSLESNASKYALTCYLDQLRAESVQLIDCQVYTSYFEGMGARMISGTEFTRLLKEGI